jgi:hypothetical protein
LNKLSALSFYTYEAPSIESFDSLTTLIDEISLQAITDYTESYFSGISKSLFVFL